MVTGPQNDLNGDDIPDMAIANQGSNDVSVFLGQITDGVWTLAYRPRQSSGGVGPASVVAKDVTADGHADLLVGNGQSDSISVLQNQGDGFFKQTDIVQTAGAPTILPTPLDTPPEAFVADPETNDLTFISNFLTAAPIRLTLSFPDGALPVVEVVPDSSGNATNELLVANAEDGLELLRSSSEGFEMEKVLAQSEIQQVSDLVVVPAGNRLEAYATGLGSDVAVLLATFGHGTSGEPLPVPIPIVIPSLPGFANGVQIATARSDGASVINGEETSPFFDTTLVPGILSLLLTPPVDEFPDATATQAADPENLQPLEILRENLADQTPPSGAIVPNREMPDLFDVDPVDTTTNARPSSIEEVTEGEQIIRRTAKTDAESLELRNGSRSIDRAPEQQVFVFLGCDLDQGLARVYVASTSTSAGREICRRAEAQTDTVSDANDDVAESSDNELSATAKSQWMMTAAVTGIAATLCAWPSIISTFMHALRRTWTDSENMLHKVRERHRVKPDDQDVSGDSPRAEGR